MDNVPWRLLCEQQFSREDLQRFAHAIEDDFYFEMFVDDLPMWGYIGEVEGEDLLLGDLEKARRYLYPHLHFQIGYNSDQLVSVNVSTFPQRKVDITDELDNTEIAFSFSVRAAASGANRAARSGSSVCSARAMAQYMQR